MSTDTLVARLRAIPLFVRNGAAYYATTHPEPTCLEAAERIEALEATIRVQEAQIESLQQTP